MTSSDIRKLPFSRTAISRWAPSDHRNSNWPVVYILDGKNDPKRRGRDGAKREVYVGESLNVAARMRQHFESIDKSRLSSLRKIVDDTFNKSVCLDLESYLIRMLAGDGSYEVLNRNDGIVDADYFDRERYRASFREIFERLKLDGVFTRGIHEIENSDLFKLSPFKSLTSEQAIAVDGVLRGLFADLASGNSSTTVLQGDPGTGKTVVAIYLLKLIVDIQSSTFLEELDSDSFFSDFFTDAHRDALKGLNIGMVVPQQSLRESIKRVFRKTPGLHPEMVMTAFDVGQSPVDFDLLIVDEAHRLNQRANQSSGVLNKKFGDINVQLYGVDDTSMTQLDWIRAKSRHQIFLLDAAQSVRPADLPTAILNDLVAGAKTSERLYPLASQMRVRAGDDYIEYVRSMLRAGPAERPSVAVSPQSFGDYDLRLFDDIRHMRAEIEQRDFEVGLSRMVAGFAWKWKSKRDRSAFDIEIDGLELRWNSTQVDWIASRESLSEVGSIHTVQGYDLNYAGVIIGPDLRWDEDAQRIAVNRSSYFDKKGKEDNRALGVTYGDEDLLRYVQNIYAVLLTRGIRGTYVYVVDPALRAHLARFIPAG
ncbi:DNA/RNA helicase domain-containing protein [Cnuibacter sp. UC19_7]|uniref:DNA/RNA helicase domain-containing protein n=1 Tax=Cnuibacter sp. UC19_7 TaxID=3350166 RepID=UPI00366B7E52